MKFGVSTFVTDEGIRPADLGRALEERGFESLFIAEHSHIPTSRETPWPGGPNMPRKYYRTLDPFVTLTAAATVTDRLVVGTGIALLIQRDPIMVAKEAASLDLVSNGRFELGVGSGWNREEMRNHGTDPATRVRLLGEQVKAVKEIWTRDEAEFHGEFVDFDPVYAWPKPVQSPHVPVLIGGEASTVIDRTLEYGDGWFPRWGGDPQQLSDQIALLRDRCAQQGRDRMPVTLFGVGENRDDIARAAELDIDRLLINLPTLDRDGTERLLDDLVSATEGLG